MTWSIPARDATTGELGVAVTTRNFSVGLLCPRAEGGVGAVATQALANPLYAPDALDQLRRGEAPDAALAALLAADPGRDQRQCHVIAWRTKFRPAARRAEAPNGARGQCREAKRPEAAPALEEHEGETFVRSV